MANTSLNGNCEELLNDRLDVTNRYQSMFAFELCRQYRWREQHATALASESERERAVIEFANDARRDCVRLEPVIELPPHGRVCAGKEHRHVPKRRRIRPRAPRRQRFGRKTAQRGSAKRMVERFHV